jgi:formylglycine-generating enzyme required for sulfatase activity
MVVDAVSVDLSRQESRAKRRLAVFCQRYDDELLRDRALELACYAAFPLTLTTDLIYHLRQQFVGDAPWYYAADVLLSGLCDPVGYDLYEMAASTRSYLLTQLFQRWREQGRDKEVELQRLANFVQGYIWHRMNVDSSLQAQRIGDPTEWLALALLYPDTVAQKITQGLSQLLEQVDSEERIRLANMVESVGDLLEGLRPIDVSELRVLARKIGQNEPIDNLGLIRKSVIAAGFPELKTAQIEYAKITFETKPQTEGTLQSFTFETVTVDRKGKLIAKSPQVAQAYIETLPEGLNLEMVAIPSGKFTMGSPESEHERYDDEGPQHEVTVPPFFMGKYAVTQAQWRLVAGLPQVERELDDVDPSNFKGSDYPVERVSWLDAEEFCLRLSVVTGREYRLPSEAQWEYACRAGTTSPFHFGETITGKIANYSSDIVYREEKKAKSRDTTIAVGSFPPNQFGLYDMHGNVWEWCMDDWHSNYDGAPKDGSVWVETAETASRKVTRGGSWYYDPRNCRSAYRYDNARVNRFIIIGFRVVCCAPSSLA